MQIGSNVGTEQAEEGGDCECFITVAEDLEIDAVVVVEDGEEGDRGVDRDHE